jgi:HK97 family phage major capsid protein
VPNQLLRVSVPQFDTILSDILGKGAGEFEDAALLATSDTANGPKCYYTTANTSKIFVGNSASGGNLAYGDLLACLAKAATVRAKGPFCWITGVRTFYTRILGLVDTSSRPICVPTLSTGLSGGIQYQLFGWPVYISPNVKEDETNSSGSAQSHIIFTNPPYLHIADGGDFVIQVSLEFLFDRDQTAIRLTHSIDSAVAPAAGVVILAGVN